MSPAGDTRDIVHNVEAKRAAVPPLKDKKRKRGMQDKLSLINSMSTAVDNFDANSEGYEDEEIMAYMSHEERRALERAVSKTTAWAEHWGDLLTRPVERRYVEESA